MTTNLPTTTPAEAVNISPEALEVANCYLVNPNVETVADELDITTELVTQILSKREVKAYIDQIFYNKGFNNRFKLSDLMDAVISKKLEEMDEADIGSTKDISELIALKHKMVQEQMAHELALAKINASNIKTQTNVQINDNSGGGSKYASLIEALLAKDNGDTIDV